ncbi:MAG TPA: SGNH/GDSL hydrolase family protein [Ramlibacter sp.]|nr:SGNH/GDSL hydrolase family protein [Ramlibacter sp.]
MATQWLRRAWLAAAGASVLLLAACGGGGGDVDSNLAPSRVIVFGDAMADIGQNASGRRYTVNDSSVNNWTIVVANAFGYPLRRARSGGTSYAVGNARVATMPGAGDDAAATSVVRQVDAFEAADNFGGNDLVLVNAGHSDIIVAARAAMEGTQTRQQALDAVGAAGTALGKQVRRIVDAGAGFVAVVGPYNLGRSPWAKQTNEEDLLEALSTAFTTKLKVEIADLNTTDSVHFLDFANQVNLFEGNPGNHGFGNVDSAVCRTRDAGEGIGTGTNQVNSSLCTSGTVLDVNYDGYLFADRIYLTPRSHRALGEFAVEQLRNRW